MHAASALAPGFYLVHKPIGPTSFDVVKQYIAAAALRSPSGRPPRICHGGTLDPFASGLLLILVEPATRLFDHLHEAPKTYTATIAWGTETDTGDLHGRPVWQTQVPPPAGAQLDEALALFLGWTDQVPPPTSNKRIAGERAYLKAHRGEQFTLPPSRVYLHEAAESSSRGGGRGSGAVPASATASAPATATATPTSTIRLTVRGGFYVRALVRDLGRRLGCGAHLVQLNRDAIGPYLDPVGAGTGAIGSPAAATASSAGPDLATPLTGRDLLPWCPIRLLTDQEIGDLRQKRTIARGPSVSSSHAGRGEAGATPGMLPPDWSLPPGFPADDLPVRGFHRDRFCFLLGEAQQDRLRVLTALRGI
jgi:tRNA pseudouridine55 synthase